MLVAVLQEGRRIQAEAVVRIDVEFTLTCAAPKIRARIVVFDEIAVRTDATAVVKRVGVGVVHTVIGARLVVVGVHVGHVGGVGGWKRNGRVKRKVVESRR